MADHNGHGELFQAIGQALVDELPDEWESVDVECEMIDFSSRFACAYTAAGGDLVAFEVPDELYPLFTELRGEMYEPGKGAWYKARFQMDSSGKFGVDFDYDSKPNLTGVLDEDYLEDLEKYPRDRELIPAWMPRPADTP
ncbi:immunity protein YezG family protein [Actinopolymorpha sp. B17G11]|uniref:immunity protein YezG family protein n=1 Tax=unclassified Actinopolymorpha TaxID=2627063 RepID=UPI0032D99D07